MASCNIALVVLIISLASLSHCAQQQTQKKEGHVQIKGSASLQSAEKESSKISATQSASALRNSQLKKSSTNDSKTSDSYSQYAPQNTQQKKSDASGSAQKTQQQSTTANSSKQKQSSSTNTTNNKNGVSASQNAHKNQSTTAKGSSSNHNRDSPNAEQIPENTKQKNDAKTNAKTFDEDELSLSFPLTTASLPLNATKSKSLYSSLAARFGGSPVSDTPRLNFLYKNVPVAVMALGTPPQSTQMMIDTGSEFSWITCENKTSSLNKQSSPLSSSSSPFNPTLSKTCTVIPCNDKVCSSPNPYTSVPTTCGDNQSCRFSYFYADGAYTEGVIVREKMMFSPKSSRNLVLGCSSDTSNPQGLLGMNLGALSFLSQSAIRMFSYCIPGKKNAVGSLVLGLNTYAREFKYTSLLSIHPGTQQPNMDHHGLTVMPLDMRVGQQRLHIDPGHFVPTADGSCQTIIDSGSEFTYLVDEVYDALRSAVLKLAGDRLLKDFVYNGIADMCFLRKRRAARLLGELAFVFQNGVELVVRRQNIMYQVSDAIHCVAVARSNALGLTGNIIGNLFQRETWVQFDLANKKVGFANAPCSPTASG